jgi:hypothetical protein
VDLSVVREKEHSYFDEFDFVAAKRDHLRKLEEQLAAAVSVNKSEVDL